jgi:hypothetical protein
LVGTGELGHSQRCLAVEEYVDAALVICKHATPAFVIGAVSEQIFSGVAAAAVPALDD